MRFYKPHTQFYCGIDLHARTMYLCVLDRNGEVLLHRNLRNDAQTFLKLIDPYKRDLVVAVECIFNWYWLADLCQDHQVEFILGHALYMKAIHGGKTKNDRIDSQKIAMLTMGGLFPMAYVYPREQRSLRDLLRRRLRFVRLRAELYTHIHTINGQLNLPGIGHTAKYKTQRGCLPHRFQDSAMSQSVQADLELIGQYDKVIHSLEKDIFAQAKQRYATQLRILLSVPGLGQITALTILYEMDKVQRFSTRQRFASYCRLVKPPKESAGKRYGSNGKKIGNPYLKWAFSEVAVHAIQFSAPIERHLRRTQHKHGKGRAKTLLAHKFGRAIYHMLRKGTVFDEKKFLRG